MVGLILQCCQWQQQWSVHVRSISGSLADLDIKQYQGHKVVQETDN